VVDIEEVDFGEDDSDGDNDGDDDEKEERFGANDFDANEDRGGMFPKTEVTFENPRLASKLLDGNEENAEDATALLQLSSSAVIGCE